MSSQSLTQLRSTCASRRNGHRARALSVSPPPQGFSLANFSVLAAFWWSCSGNGQNCPDYFCVAAV